MAPAILDSMLPIVGGRGCMLVDLHCFKPPEECRVSHKAIVKVWQEEKVCCLPVWVCCLAGCPTLHHERLLCHAAC